MKAKDYIHISKTFFGIILSCFILPGTCGDIYNTSTDDLRQQKDDGGPVKDSRVLFSPRMDYDQWKPIGQVDPLKNDPTYDYAPPVLDRVHYWIDPASRKPDPPNSTDNKKTEILVLGVSSKKPGTEYSTMADSRKDLFDSFLKFVDGPNLGYRARPQYTAPQTYYSSAIYYKNIPEQKEPYTMLVPPPMPTTERNQMNFQQPIISSTSTTTPVPYTMSSSGQGSVAIDEANLVYQSSSVSTGEDWKGSDTYATVAESSSQVTWKTPVPDTVMNNTYNKMQNLPTLKSPGKFKDTANISIVPSMKIVVKPLNKQNSKNMETDIIVVPPEVTHKGQVSDDVLDISNTYVNIGKPETYMQTVNGMVVDTLTKSPTKQQHLLNSPLVSSVMNPMITPVSNHPMFRKPHLPMKKLEMMPMTLQTMQTMQTMLPPPATQHVMHKKPLIHNLLKKEMTSMPAVPTTTFTPPMTTTSSLTTDALFKHYKQPMEPVRGPMYLIIQGHSKVKTYGPSKQISGILIQETNEIPSSDDRQTEFPVKHLHELMKDKEAREQWDREKRDFRAGRLQTLKHIVQTGLGAMDFDEAIKRSDDDIKETEFILKYDVSSGGEGTSEVYHKGIVESEQPPK